MKFHKVSFAILAAALVAFGVPAKAEVSEVRVAKQLGISYLPLMYMENLGLLEKHAKAQGIADLKITWSTFTGGGPMNDALISGNLHFASGGVGPFATLWDRTRGSLGVKGVTAMNSMPLYLNTRNPNVKTIKDFTPKDKIALPSVKVSIQAVTLQMAAEQAFGEGNHGKLDALTVSMGHVDGMAALLSGAGEITAHFTSPPYQYQELAQPGIRRVLSSYEALGGPATFNVVWTTTKFREANPKVYKAFLAAFEEAIDLINKDKRAAAENYLKWSKEKDTVENIYKILNDPEIEYTTTPKNVMKYVDFLHKVGTLKAKPASWKEMFFPEVHHLPGS